MKNTTKGFLAGAAGLGLVLGGSTFALWTDSDSFGGEMLRSGNLEVKVDKANWKDMSDDRTDEGHNIRNLRGFRIIPGDVIQVSYPVNVGLQGDNMVAKLNLTEKGKGTHGTLADGLDISYEIQNRRGDTVATGTDGAEVTLASRDNWNSPWDIRVGSEARGRADFSVVVTVEFDEDTNEREMTQAWAKLTEAELELTQVREDAPGYND